MKLYKRLAKYLKPYQGRLVSATLCMAIVAALTAYRIYLLKPLQDEVFISRDFQTLAWLIWFLPLLSVLLGIFGYGANYLMAHVAQHSINDMRQHMFAHLQDMSMDFFTATSSGRTVALFTNDLNALQQVIARVPIYLVRDGLKAIFYLSAMFYLNWRFALMTLAVLPVAGLTIYLIGRKLRRVGRRGQQQMGELYSVIHETIQAAPVIKAYTAESMEKKRLGAISHRTVDLGLRFAKADTLSSPLMETIGILIFSLLLWVGGHQMLHGLWSPGDFVAFVAFTALSYQPIKNFSEMNAQIQLGLASTERIFELLDLQPSVKEVPSPQTLASFAGEIRYDGVSFRYPKSRVTAVGHNGTETTPAPEPVSHEHRWALREVDLRVKRGEVVALVGSSGAGKSTLALLLPRFYDPTEGVIRLDGQDIREASFASLRRQISLVTQEVLLFNETVRYNIAYGRPEASTQEVEAAAEAANAHAFIKRLPQGYDTVIGERGVRLSGGERQRLSIARALLKNPPILILDEATSSLDAESERLVQEALERLMEHRTALVIAHRLATVRRADRIVVLEQGRIIEEGNHAALLSRQGTYFKLHNLQILH